MVALDDTHSALPTSACLPRSYSRNSAWLTIVNLVNDPPIEFGVGEELTEKMGGASLLA